MWFFFCDFTFLTKYGQYLIGVFFKAALTIFLNFEMCVVPVDLLNKICNDVF